MSLVAPAGPVYQAGTLSGNPAGGHGGPVVARAAVGRSCIGSSSASAGVWPTACSTAADDAGVALQVNRAGSMLTPFFTASPVRDYATALQSDTRKYATFFQGLLARGVYPPASQFEAWFLSGAHTEADIDRTIAAARAVLRTEMRP